MGHQPCNLSSQTGLGRPYSGASYQPLTHPTRHVVGWGLVVCATDAYPKQFERLNYLQLY